MRRRPVQTNKPEVVEQREPLTKRCFCFGLNTDDVQRSHEYYVTYMERPCGWRSAGYVLFFAHRGCRTGTHPGSRFRPVAEAAAGSPTIVRTLQTDPLPISPTFRNLCKANNIADSRLKNESVSTAAALLSIVPDHISSLYLDGAAIRYS